MAEWGYDCRTFGSFDELKDAMPSIAQELADNYDPDAMGSMGSIWVFPDAGEYAVYEVVDGWYSEHDLGSDYNGAPDLLEFIDFNELGDALVSSWDDSCNYQASDGSIVTFC